MNREPHEPSEPREPNRPNRVKRVSNEPLEPHEPDEPNRANLKPSRTVSNRTEPNIFNYNLTVSCSIKHACDAAADSGGRRGVPPPWRPSRI